MVIVQVRLRQETDEFFVSGFFLLRIYLLKYVQCNRCFFFFQILMNVSKIPEFVAIVNAQILKVVIDAWPNVQMVFEEEDLVIAQVRLNQVYSSL